MAKYILLDFNLQVLKDFLSKNLEAAGAEVTIINEKNEAGGFRELGDLESALDVPFERLAIAIRAVCYEINALVEWELRILAGKPYQKSARYATTPKFLGDVPLEKVSRIKFIYDLPIKEVYRLIEEYYKIDLSNLPGFTEVQRVRQAVNAFKHRKGFKDFRRDPGSNLLECFEITSEEAYKTIDGARSFLKALWKKLGV